MSKIDISQRSLADLFCREAVSLASSRKHTDLMMLSNKDFFALPRNDRDVVWHAHAIKRVQGYRLDDKVARAVTKLIGSSFTTYTSEPPTDRVQRIHKALERTPHLYTPPFPVIWVEWQREADNQQDAFKNGLLIESLPNHEIRTTIFAWTKAEGCFPNVKLPIYFHEGTPTHNASGRIYTKGGSIRFAHEVESNETSLSNIRKLTSESYIFALATLMIMKSRTNVLATLPPPPNVQRQPGVKGRNPALSPHKSLGFITFDLVRTLFKRRASTEAEAAKFMEEQIVSGHFKLREVRMRDDAGRKLEGFEHQLLWWNPHWRGGTEAEKASRADQLVIKARSGEIIISDESRPLTVPGMDIRPNDYKAH